MEKSSFNLRRGDVVDLELADGSKVGGEFVGEVAGYVFLLNVGSVSKADISKALIFGKEGQSQQLRSLAYALPKWYEVIGLVVCTAFAFAAYILLGDGRQDTIGEQVLWPLVIPAAGFGAWEFWQFVGNWWANEWNRRPYERRR